MKKTNNLLDIYSGVKKNNPDRRENDLYETAPIATWILHKYGNVPKTVVEPCAGRGSIAIELERCGHDVLAFDLNKYENNHFAPIITGQDVLSLEKPKGFEAFITNPPYFKDLPRKIAEKGIAEYDYTALFIRLTFFEGMRRNKLFTKTPPSDILFLSDRINFKQNLIKEPIDMKDQIGGMIAYCWVIWNKKVTHENTRCRWILLKNEYNEWRKHYDQWKDMKYGTNSRLF